MDYEATYYVFDHFTWDVVENGETITLSSCLDFLQTKTQSSLQHIFLDYLISHDWKLAASKRKRQPMKSGATIRKNF